MAALQASMLSGSEGFPLGLSDEARNKQGNHDWCNMVLAWLFASLKAIAFFASFGGRTPVMLRARRPAEI